MMLKSCPFCGNHLSIRAGVNGYGRCDTEGCWIKDRFVVVPLDDERQTTAWNCRATPLASTGAVSGAERDVLAERRRQIDVEGWSPDHDDTYDASQLASAAACYAAFTDAFPAGDPPRFWPWDVRWWKPSTRRQNLIKAGALIIAEIERLDRSVLKAAEETGKP